MISDRTKKKKETKKIYTQRKRGKDIKKEHKYYKQTKKNIFLYNK